MLQVGVRMPSGSDNATRRQNSITALQWSNVEGGNWLASAMTLGYNAKEAQLPCQGATTQPLNVVVVQQQDETSMQDCNIVEVGLHCPRSGCRAQLTMV
jgi:hypothetical protein